MNIWGEALRLSIFGESHGAAIGIVIDGLPGGIPLDMDQIRAEMQRRAPGRDALSTPRKEADQVEIVSGFFEGRTTGTPLTGLIYNTNTRSKDYQKDVIRPGHADYTGFVRYGAAHDYRGGGHFSGRITAPLVFAGAVAKQLLKRRGVTVGAHISRLGSIADKPFDPVSLTGAQAAAAGQKPFPVLDDAAGAAMQKAILDARGRQDSVGGVVECAVCGMPAGAGAPFFGSVESRLSSLLFSIPAVKGVAFGLGFGFADVTGKEANDEFYVKDGKIYTHTNHNAGVNGGITNGMPLLFTTVIKPTPSIAQPQRTVDLSKMENVVHTVHGRHDPCIVQRAVVVVEAAAALTMLDLLMDDKVQNKGEKAEGERDRL